MADLTTSTVRAHGLAASAPVYTAVAATDSFTAKAGVYYELHYKNGATPGTGLLKVVDQTAQAPAGISLAAGWADLPVVTNMAASSEIIVTIPSDRYRDGQGKINLAHAGTLTTITVAIRELPKK